MFITLGSHGRRDSDREFFEALYQSYKRLMYSTAKKYVSDSADREDVIQDALVRLIKKTALLREMDRPALAGYIVYTVRSTCIDHLRKSRRISGHLAGGEDPDVDECPREDFSLDELVIVRERLDGLKAVWPSLSEEDRLLLEGKYVWGSTDEELARVLGCRPASIRMKRTRARRKVLEALNEKEGGGDEES